MQTLALQFTDDTNTLIAAIARSRTDLTLWTRVTALADSGGTAGASTVTSDPTSTVLPCVLIQNTSDTADTPEAVAVTFKATHGGSAITVYVPAGDFVYLPQIDYTYGVTLATTINTAACVIWFGFA